MTFERYLDQLRAKPEPVRRRITVLTSAAITGVVLIIWLINWSVTASAPPVRVDDSRSFSDHLERVRVGFMVSMQSLRNSLP